jgi:hypothetical protein
MSAFTVSAHPTLAEVRSASRGGSSATLIAFLLILAWTSLVSVPTFGFDDADDAFFVEVANQWNRGLAPFAASFDIKGLGFFALLAIAEKALGPSLTTLKLVAALFSAIGGAALHKLCARYDRAAAMVCAALYPILVIISGDACYTTMNAFLLIAFASAFSVWPAPRKAILAGLTVGFACTIKQTCVVDAAALLFILVDARLSKGERLTTTAAFLATAALAPAGFLLCYFAHGDAGILIQDLVVKAFNRPSGIGWREALGWLAEWLWPFSVVIVLALFALANPRVIERRFPLRPMLCWLVLEFLGILAQHGGSRTAMVPMIAPMLIISYVFVSENYGQNSRVRHLSVLALFGTLEFAAAMYGHGLTILQRLPKVDQDVLRQTAAAVAATHPRDEDRLFALNGAVWSNIVTNLSPPTPYFHWNHIMCEFPGAGFPALAGNFEAKPRYIVYENPNRRSLCQTAAIGEEIKTELAAHYRLISTARSQHSIYEVFEVSR